MTFAGFLATIFSGTNLALLGGAIAVILTGIGSAKGVGMVAEASAGVLAEDPSKFGRTLTLQVLPGTQGIYGFATMFLILLKTGILSGTPVALTPAQGLFFGLCAMPIAFAGYFSAVKQARVAVSGVSVVAKRPEEFGKTITSAVLVEMYAILALLVSILPILTAKI